MLSSLLCLIFKCLTAITCDYKININKCETLISKNKLTVFVSHLAQMSGVIDQAQLTRDIEDARVDVNGLSKEIEGLEAELLTANQNVEKLSKQLEEEERKLIDTVNGHKDKNHNRKRNYHMDENLDPPRVQHSYFDESITHFFTIDHVVRPRLDNMQQHINIDDLAVGITQKAKQVVAMKENILYENIFRFNGITAFPLNEAFMAGTEFLGLRFDNFSSVNNKFLDPHYVILRKEQIDSKQHGVIDAWKVYRDTLPAFIPTEEISHVLIDQNNDEGLLLFATTIRKYLVKIQFKHDTLVQLPSCVYNILYTDPNRSFGSGSPLFSIDIDRDLSCLRVVIQVKSKSYSSSITIVLECDNEKVYNAVVTPNGKQGQDSNASASMEAFLRNVGFGELTSRFKKVIQLLLDQQLI